MDKNVLISIFKISYTLGSFALVVQPLSQGRRCTLKSLSMTCYISGVKVAYWVQVLHSKLKNCWLKYCQTWTDNPPVSSFNLNLSKFTYGVKMAESLFVKLKLYFSNHNVILNATQVFLLPLSNLTLSVPI